MVKARNSYDQKYKDPLPSAEVKGDLWMSHDVKAIFHYLRKLMPDLHNEFPASGLLRSFGLSKVTDTWQVARYSVDPSDRVVQGDFQTEYDNLRQ